MLQPGYSYPFAACCANIGHLVVGRVTQRISNSNSSGKEILFLLRKDTTFSFRTACHRKLREMFLVHVCLLLLSCSYNIYKVTII